MTIEQDLQNFILSKYKSISQFASASGIPYTTVKGGLERGIMGMSVQNVIKMCRALSIDVDKLSEGKIEPAKKKNIALDVNEFNLINQFRAIDENGKNLVIKVTAHEYDRCIKSESLKLAEDEKTLINQYRKCDENGKKVISSVLNMTSDIDAYRAAMSDDDHADEIIKMSKAEVDRLLSLPMTDEDL